MSDKFHRVICVFFNVSSYQPCFTGIPRLLIGAKAFAAIQGRDFVVPDDVLYLVNPVLRHRVQLSSEKELEGVTVDQVVQQIVSKIEVPR